MIHHRHITCLCAAMALSSCSLFKESAPKEESKHLSFSERLNERNGYKQDAAGNWVPMNDKRSSFESQGRSPYFKGTQSKKEFNTESYTKKSWGHKDYETKDYDHGKDASRFVKGSRFNQQLARESTRDQEASKQYQTNRFGTKTANESNKDGISKNTDYQTEKRRKVYVPPDIIDYKQQREMSVDESKGILGRLRD